MLANLPRSPDPTAAFHLCGAGLPFPSFFLSTRNRVFLVFLGLIFTKCAGRFHHKEVPFPLPRSPPPPSFLPSYPSAPLWFSASVFRIVISGTPLLFTSAFMQPAFFPPGNRMGFLLSVGAPDLPYTPPPSFGGLTIRDINCCRFFYRIFIFLKPPPRVPPISCASVLWFRQRALPRVSSRPSIRRAAPSLLPSLKTRLILFWCSSTNFL